VHEYPTFVPDTVDVGCFSYHQSAVVDARLHPADVIAPDEQDIGFLVLRQGRNDCAEKRSRDCEQRQAVMDYVSFHWFFIVIQFLDVLSDVGLSDDS
jgi:hypothetical protein